MSKRKPNQSNSQNPIIGWMIGGGVLLAVVAVILLLTGQATQAAQPISQLTTEDFHSLAFSPTDAETIYFGHHHGLLVSQNGGKDWQPTSLSNADAMALALPASSPQVMYAAGHEVFYKSNDAGKSWLAVKTNLPSLDIHGFAADPNDANRVFAHVANVGIFGASDGGSTWTQLSNTAPPSTYNLTVGENAQTLYAAAPQEGLWRSTDGGKNWAKVESLPSEGGIAVAYAPASKRLYVTTLSSAPGLYISDDGAKTWVLAIKGTWLAIAISPLDANHLVIINENGQVYASRDHGKTWSGK